MSLRVNSNTAQLKKFFYNTANSRLSSWLLLCAFFWMVAAASLGGFAGKWGLLDGQSRGGIEAMLDATASKPILFRQLAPMLANFVDSVAPKQLKERALSINPSDTFARMTSAAKPSIHFRYIIVYYLVYLSLLLSLFTLRRVLLDLGMGNTSSIIAPSAFILALPYLQTNGGYFYDSIELLFTSLAVLIAIRGNIVLLILVALVATLNKETFVFFIPALYPILRYKLSPGSALKAVLLTMLAAVIVNVLIKLAFVDASGGAFEFNMLRNMKAYLTPWTYIHHENTYGIFGPQGAFFGTIIIIFTIVIRAWPLCPIKLRQHLLISAALNLPLFIGFCAIGELRNLSLMFIGFVVLIAIVIEQRIKRELACTL